MPAVKPRRRPELRLVHSSLAPVALIEATSDWRRIASAVLACTHELGRHLLEQRWVRVDECLGQRRELLGLLAEMRLDTDGRRCLLALEQAASESELAIEAMKGISQG
jgi:hypothetical protein